MLFWRESRRMVPNLSDYRWCTSHIPTDFTARRPSEKQRMLVIRKQGLSDVSADDLRGSAEDPWHLHATKLKGIRVKGRHTARHWFHLAVTWWTALCAASWNILQYRLSSWCLWGLCKVEVILQSVSQTLFVKNLLYKIIVAHSTKIYA